MRRSLGPSEPKMEPLEPEAGDKETFQRFALAYCDDDGAADSPRCLGLFPLRCAQCGFCLIVFRHHAR